MNSKFSFQTRLGALFVLVIFTVTLSGVFAYKNLSGLLESARQQATPDLRVSLLKSLTNQIKEAEVEAKAYRLTGDDTHITNFFSIVNEMDDHVAVLQNACEEEYQLAHVEQIKSAVDSKFSVLVELLQLQGQNDVEQALEKVSREIKVKSDELSNSKSNRPGLLQRMFRFGKARDSSNESADELTNELETSINQIKKEEQEKEIARSHLELGLTLKSDSIDKVLIDLEEQIEEDVRKTTASAMALNQKQTKQASIFIVSFCVLAALMLALMFYITFKHLAHNRVYRKALKEAKNKAEDLANTKEQFVANMSHEIRTPLNALLGFVDQAMQGPLEPQQKEQLEIAHKSGEHLAEVVNEILDFSQLSAQKFQFVEIPFAPKELLIEVKHTFETRCRQKGLDFKLEIKETTPNAVIGDPKRLKQILFNLVGNSVKFTETGSLSISLEPSADNEQDGSLKFMVSDTGIGIPENKLDVVFEEFEQTHGSLDDSISSTGLGLSITKMLVEQQGGHISVSSKMNQGTQVTFEIPYTLSEETVLTTSKESVIKPELIAGKSVLIADDNSYNRQLLATILSKWNLPHKEVSNGLQAVETMDETPCDIVLMDLRMPEMDGFEAAAAIRKKHTVPIIAVTAGLSEEDEKKCLASGMNGFLEKPFKEDQLFKVLVGDQKAVADSKDYAEAQTEVPLYNLDELESMSQGNTKFVIEMIELFIVTTQESLASIEECIQQKDWEMAAEYAHRMAGPSKHLEAMSLYHLIKKIEESGRSGTRVEQIPDLLKKARIQAEKISDGLQKKLRELKNNKDPHP